MESTVKRYYEAVLDPDLSKTNADEACSLLWRNGAVQLRDEGGNAECSLGQIGHWRSEGAEVKARIKHLLETDDPTVTVCGDRAALDHPGPRILLVKVEGT